MIIEEKKYTGEEFEQLAKDLMQSPDLDAELKYVRRSVLPFNPMFYPMLFSTVDMLRESATQTKDENLLSELTQFKTKLYEYTNIIPTDLPGSIVGDKRLVDILLTDYPTINRNDKDWIGFQRIIQEKADSISQSLVLPFFEWCIEMLAMNLKRHNQVCSNPLSCPINIGYDRRIQFFKKLIEVSTPPQPTPIPMSEEPTKPEKRKAKKVQWMGTQKELAELFIRLRAKGWIAEFEPETIKDCFTNANSIHQYLKPGEYTEDLGGTFEQVFTPEYSPKFHGIQPNPNRDK